MSLVHNPGGLDRRSFVKGLACGPAAAAIGGSQAACRTESGTGRRVIVLGLDGLDPHLLKRLIEAGRGPNFKRLAEDRVVSVKLATTMPALSPVAWSSFITGLTPGGHGIADFVTRDPASYLPVFSIFENRDPEITFSVGDLRLPIKGGGPENLRHGRPFFSIVIKYATGGKCLLFG